MFGGSLKDDSLSSSPLLLLPCFQDRVRGRRRSRLCVLPSRSMLPKRGESVDVADIVPLSFLEALVRSSPQGSLLRPWSKRLMSTSTCSMPLSDGGGGWPIGGLGSTSGLASANSLAPSKAVAKSLGAEVRPLEPKMGEELIKASKREKRAAS